MFSATKKIVLIYFLVALLDFVHSGDVRILLLSIIMELSD